ncbi:MAG: ribosomal protein S18-alanine N-acetyltransferase [Blastocatellia bacterium]
MLEWQIEVVGHDDIDELIAIGGELGLSPWTRQNYLDELDRSDAIILKLLAEGTGIAGFLVARYIAGSGVNVTIDAELYNIGIRKIYQKNGHGRELMRTFLDKCRAVDVNTVWLDVRRSNTTAIRFYSSFGFLKHSIRKAFYRDPVEDATVMWLEIDEYLLRFGNIA